MKRFLFLLSFVLCSLCMTAQPFIYTTAHLKKGAAVGQSNSNNTLLSSAWMTFGEDTTTKAIRIPCVVDTGNVAGTKKKGLIAYSMKRAGIIMYDGTKWILPLSTKTISAAGVVDSLWIGFTHGLSWTPTVYSITSTSSIAKSVTYWSADSAKIYVHFRDTVKATTAESFDFLYR